MDCGRRRLLTRPPALAFLARSSGRTVAAITTVAARQTLAAVVAWCAWKAGLPGTQTGDLVVIQWRRA